MWTFLYHCLCECVYKRLVLVNYRCSIPISLEEGNCDSPFQSSDQLSFVCGSGECMHGWNELLITMCACGCKNDQPSICNPLLAYAVNVMQSNPKNVIKRTVLGFYTPDEIHDAKEDLWSKCDAAVIGPNVSRKGSKNKKRQEFEIDDILDALGILDAKEIPKNIHVSANDLCRIPPNQPGEMLDFALADRITDLEIRVNGNNGIMSQISMLIEDNRRLNRLVAQLKQSVSASTSYASVTTKEGSKSLMPVKATFTSSKPQGPDEVSQPMPTEQTEVGQQPQQQRTSSLSSMTLPKQPQHAQDPSADDDFQIPKQHDRRLRRRQRLLGTRNTPPNSRFRGAPPPQRQLFIYRAMRETTCDDILQHVKDLNLNVNIEKVECVSDVKAKFKSFVVTCNIDTYKLLLNGDLWPVGCGVRRYNPPRRSRDEAKSTSNANSPHPSQ